ATTTVTADASTTVDTTTTATEPTTTTAPATSVVTTTVEQTTTQVVTTPTSTTTSTEEHGESGTPAWVWALLGILAIALIALIVLLARRGKGGVGAEERRQQLHAAVGSWTGQGWAIESESSDSAVLRRGAEVILVSIDAAGHISTRPIPS